MACSTVQSHIDYELHEMIYSWETEEDIWGSVSDVEQTRQARAALVEAFDPSKPVKERSIEHLHQAVAVVRQILDTPNATAWSECNEAAKTTREDQTNLRANTILLLHRHLEWIWSIFKHVPGASVTVR